MGGSPYSETGIARRLPGTLILWLLLAVALYLGFWALLLASGPGVHTGGFIGAAWQGARYYFPIVLIAMAVPAALHLFAPRRVAWWSRLFVATSIVLPGAYLLFVHSDYERETARGVFVEGVGLWNGFATLSLFGLYASLASLTFAAVLSARELRAGRRIALVHLSVAAAAVLLYVALYLSRFAPFFAWIYAE